MIGVVKADVVDSPSRSTFSAHSDANPFLRLWHQKLEPNKAVDVIHINCLKQKIVNAKFEENNFSELRSHQKLRSRFE